MAEEKRRRNRNRLMAVLAMVSIFSLFPSNSVFPAHITDISRDLNASHQLQASQLSGIILGKEKKGPKIPQTRDRRWVHQGLEYLPLSRWFVFTAYVYGTNKHEREASKLSVVDEKSGKRVKTVHLYESEDRQHVGHVGGVTATKNHLYVASTVGKKNLLLRFRLEDLKKVRDGEKLVADKIYDLPHRTSYVKFVPNNWLLVGEWVPKNGRKNGTIQAYWLDEQGDPHHVREFRTPKGIQGVEVIGNLFFLSQSLGRKNISRILVQKGLGQQAKKPLIVRELETPMAQNITVIEKNGVLHLAINNESDTFKYKKDARKVNPNLIYIPITGEKERVRD